MLKIGRKKYYTNRAKGTVAAVPSEIDLTEDFGPNGKEKTAWLLCTALNATNGPAGTFFEPRAAVARCAGNDVFDENVGKIIASAKCDANIHMTAAASYDRAIAEMKAAIALAEEMKRKHVEKAEACNEVIARCAGSRKEAA